MILNTSVSFNVKVETLHEIITKKVQKPSDHMLFRAETLSYKKKIISYIEQFFKHFQVLVITFLNRSRWLATAEYLHISRCKISTIMINKGHKYKHARMHRTLGALQKFLKQTHIVFFAEFLLIYIIFICGLFENCINNSRQHFGNHIQMDNLSWIFD